MKKLLLSVLTLTTFASFGQWQNTTNYTGKDIYYAFGVVLESDGNSSGLGASTDEGQSYTSSNTGIPSSGVNFGTYNSGLLYAYHNEQIYSTSNGSSWALMTSAIPINDAIKGMTTINGTVMAVSNPLSPQSFKTWYLNGSSWALKGTTTGTFATTIRNLNGALWVGTTNQCVAKSTDGGVTFAGSYTGFNTVGANERYVNCIGSTASSLFAGNAMGRIYRSTNNGANWSNVHNINPSATLSIYINDFYTTPGGIVLVASDSGFVYSVDDGATWTKNNTGLNYSQNENQLTKITMSPNYILATTKRSNGSVVRLPISQTSIGIKEIGMPMVESKIYPNPAHQFAIIESDKLIYEDNCSVILNDVLGREIGIFTMNSGKASIDLSGFNQGLYSYKVCIGKTVISKGKLVVE